MKIVHVQQFYNENMGYQENILPRYQQRLGHEVVLLTSTWTDGFNDKNRKRQPGDYQEDGFLVKRLPCYFHLRQKFAVFQNLDRALEAERPDYIFHHGCAAPSIGAVSRYKRKNPRTFVVLDNHSDLTISIHNPILKTLYYNIIWNFYLKRHDPWINLYFGVTPARCLFLAEEFRVKPEKIRLLPIGADTEHHSSTSDRTSFLNRFHLEEDCTLFVHGGKMTPHKKVSRILQAFSRIDDAHIRLILFGQVEDPEVQRLIDLDSRIKFIGWLNREDTLFVLRNCDVGIWNSQHTTLLEDAVAVGLPLVVRYYGSTSHLVDKTGLFLYDGSTREIQDHLELMLEHPALLNSFKDQAFFQAQRLSYATIARESIDYAARPDNMSIFEKYMGPDYSDLEHPQFRKLIDV